MLALVAFLSGGLGHLLGAKTNNKLNTAKAAESVANSALALLEVYEARIHSLEQRVASLEAKVAEYERKI